MPKDAVDDLCYQSSDCIDEKEKVLRRCIYISNARVKFYFIEQRLVSVFNYDHHSHQGSILIMENVASVVFNYVMDGNIFINYLRAQFKNVERLQ